MHAAPVERYAIRIREAHKLGHGPGQCVDICDLGLQRKALQVWKETLPPAFLGAVADSYVRCAQLMGAVLSDGSAQANWDILARYLGAVATAMGEDSDLRNRQPTAGAPAIKDMPEVIRFESLAELMHPDAVETLRGSSAAVARYCRFGLHSAPDDTQLVCLQGLADGDRQADIAKRLGYSQRHIQRILADLWHQFGVENAIQGLSFAVAQGWIAVSRTPPSPQSTQPNLRRILSSGFQQQGSGG